MFLRKVARKLAFVAVVLLLPAISVALDISVQPLIPGTITNVQLSHFDIEGSGRGAPIFRVVVDNTGGTDESDLIVVYTFEIVSNIVEGGSQVLYKGATENFSLAANQRMEVMSTEFLNENSSTPLHLKYRIERLKNPSVQTKVLASGTVPTGTVKISMYLAKGRYDSHVKVEDADLIETEIVNVSQLDLIAPGSSAIAGSDESMAISSLSPRFSWASDLRANMYDNCDRCLDKSVFEISIYERKPGQGTNEVLASNPIVREKTTVPYFEYPSYSRPLVPGTTYFWRVKGFLKGIVDASFISEPFAFTVSQTIDPEVARQQQLISSMLYSRNYGGIFDALKRDYSAGITVLYKEKSITEDELKELLKRFNDGQYKIVNVRVE